MVAEVEIKLQDLVKLALGTPELTNVNVAILQSLIEILLKKLNCHNETVSLNAFEAKHLESLLKTAKGSPIVFNDENVEKISEKLERLSELQENVAKLDEKLNKHLTEVQAQGQSNLNATCTDLKNWSSCEDEHLCSACDEKNELACAILKNTDFIKKLQRRMAAPIVDRLFDFEAKIEQLNERFQEFIKRAKDIYLNVQLYEKCMAEIEKLNDVVEEQKRHFLMTMEEIQDMLDSKLDKIHVPALKKYIRDNFAKIDRSINDLQDKQKCPRAAGIIMGGIRCASCGNANVCSEIGVLAASMLPDVKAKKPFTKKFCIPLDETDHKLKSYTVQKVVHLEGLEDLKRKKNSSKCHKTKNHFELVEGSDGKLYRKG